MADLMIPKAGSTVCLRVVALFKGLVSALAHQSALVISQVDLFLCPRLLLRELDVPVFGTALASLPLGHLPLVIRPLALRSLFGARFEPRLRFLWLRLEPLPPANLLRQLARIRFASPIGFLRLPQ